MQTPKSKPIPIVRVTPTDTHVIEAALADFALRETWLLGPRLMKNRRLLIDSFTYTVYEQWLTSELRREKWKIPDAVRHNLRERNKTRVRLTGLQLRSSTIHAINLTKPIEDMHDFYTFWKDQEKKYTDLKAFVTVCLPGFSKDGKTAAVRFYFAPTPHGGYATFLLERGETDWVVKHCKISGYI